MIDDKLFTNEMAAQARTEINRMRDYPHFVHTAPTFIAFGTVT